MTLAKMFDYFGLTLQAAGCPNSCRHCSAEGAPPYGELISLVDVQSIAAQVKSLANTFLLYITDELTAHPDFVSLWQLCGRESNDPEADLKVLSTNGYGIARSTNWREQIEDLKEAGTEAVDLTFHGIETTHDWFARRSGAYRDLLVTMERMAACGVKILPQFFLDRRNIRELSALLTIIEQLGAQLGQDLNLHIEIPGYVACQRLREFEESLRPVTADLEPVESILVDRGRYQPLTEYTEKSVTERIMQDPTQPELRLLFDREFDRRSVGLYIDKHLNVFQGACQGEWPDKLHGSLKTDTLANIVARMAAWHPPRLPDIAVLAERYGDLQSELVHPYGLSVQMKWIDRFRQDGGQMDDRGVTL